jgi:hypothetical protein
LAIPSQLTLAFIACCNALQAIIDLLQVAIVNDAQGAQTFYSSDISLINPPLRMNFLLLSK